MVRVWEPGTEGELRSLRTVVFCLAAEEERHLRRCPWASNRRFVSSDTIMTLGIQARAASFSGDRQQRAFFQGDVASTEPVCRPVDEDSSPGHS